MSDKPLRVLMVTEDIPAAQVGGLGKHVVALGNALIRQGHEVALLGRSDVDYEQARREVGFDGRFIPGFHFRRHGWKEASLGVWFPMKRRHLARRIERAIERVASAYDVIHYHGHLPMVGLGLPATLPLLQTRHDQGTECLTHTRFVNGTVCTASAPSACAGCAAKAPNALQRAVSTTGVVQYRRQVEANVAQRPTIFVSAFLRDQYLKVRPGADVSQTQVIHNFVQFDRLQRLGVDKSPVAGRVFMAGRIDAAKGFELFLQAWTAFGGAGDILIAGDGPERVRLAEAYGQQATFLGWTPYDQAVELTATAHACVVPSVWQEPCGTSIIEALALGRPCFALRRGGTPELVRYQQYDGQLALFDTMEDLVVALKQHLANHPKNGTLASTSDADVDTVLPQILRAYHHTIQLARRPGHV